MVGMVIGYIAVQTGSLLPCIIFHFTHNSLSVLSGRVTAELVEQFPLLGLLFQPSDSEMLAYTYNWALVVLSVLASFALLHWFRRLPHERSAEEQLRETLKHQITHATAEA